tara:strand:- start:4820 stop:6817 length:1998 start_codon:yes stop_codon:yes gene_type:complete
MIKNQNVSKKNIRYRPEIDGLRGFAILAVIINHFNKDILPSGYLGVDIFFVISGYVITSSLYGTQYKKIGNFLSSFYSRRIKRLYPALLVFVLIISFITYLFDPTIKQNLRMGFTSLLGISNIYVFQQQSDYFGPAQELNPLLHTWSLAVEEQFYLVFPFITWFSGFNRNTKKGSENLFNIMSAIVIASYTIFYYLYNLNLPAAYFLTSSRVWEIGLGCICFLFMQKRTRLQSKLQIISPSFYIFLIILSMFLPVKYGLLTTTLVVVCTTLLLISLKEKTFLYTLFTRKKIVYIGLLSYSLYLWHWGVLSISRLTIGIHWWSVPIQIAILLVLAKLSNKYLERPLRNISLTNKSQIFVIWFLALSSSSVLLYGFQNISNKLFLGKKVTAKNNFSNYLKWDKENCASGFSTRNKSINFDNCWIYFSDKDLLNKQPKEKINIYSYGNSYNMQLVPVLKQLIKNNKNKYEYKINVVSCPGIPSSKITRLLKTNNPCVNTFQNYIKWSLNNSSDRSILLINTSMSSFSGKDILFDLNKNKVVSTNYAKKVFADELTSIGARANSKQIDFYITSGIPNLLVNPVTCGNWFNQLNSKPCNSLDPNSKNLQLEPFEDILKLTSNDVIGLNIYNELEKVLSSKKNLSIYFKNINHISDQGALLLFPLFQKKLI